VVSPFFWATAFSLNPDICLNHEVIVDCPN
jgi:hypothetical protein